MTAHGIELLLRGQRVAAHARNDQRGGFSTVEAHMPAAHRAHMEWTPQRLIEWGQRIGMSCGELITRLLQTYKHPEHGYRSCLGLLSLSRQYGPLRLEAACERAIAISAPSYGSLKSILKHGLDKHRVAAPAQTSLPLDHANVRGPAYYH